MDDLQKNFSCPSLTPEQKNLFNEGFHLLEHVKAHKDEFSDYSFIVFPFAKAYEGYLKGFFLDKGLISRDDFYSRHFRIGKAMSPSLGARLRPGSVYKKICDRFGCDLSEEIWQTWKKGRNEVFHYFADNVKALSLAEAEERIQMILKTVRKTCEELH